MMLKRKAITGKPRSGWLRSAGALLVAAATAVTLVAGCLDRPVVKQNPNTSNVYVAEIRQTAVDKIDLLFMIDNSISMADKQAILGDAVGSLANRLITPICVTATGQPTGMSSNANGDCPNGSSPEFTPIRDIHIGVVSSSLGAHGGQTCADAAGNDKGQLVPLVRTDPMYPVATWNNSGFLFWDPGNKGGGTTNLPDLQKNFTNMVLAVGQSGCGFESTLEGWYRFLIDPEPIIDTPMVTDGSVTKPVFNSDPSNPVLQQRAAFLRPDSLVAIIMLSDENDCSIVDDGQGWLVGTQTFNGTSFRMPRSTTQCATNPNDACCASCLAENDTPCGKPKDDANCKAGTYYAPADDALNLRCFKQKQRFGFDLLYPTSRYVDGLYESQIRNRSGQMVANPLFAAGQGAVPRDKSLVFLAGIVGVPWQDIAVNANDAQLNYKTYKEIDWNLLLGTPGDDKTPPQAPGDKLMFETVVDRTTLFGNQPHPIIGGAGALAPATATGRPNAINGHEVNTPKEKNDDLQYACIFPLPTARQNCSGAGCDCDPADAAYNRPLCDGSTQVYAKAYPGVRELQVLKDFGSKGTQNSIVASICPKTLNKGDSSYGYNPAVAAIIDRLKEALKGKCLPRQLIPDPENEGKVPCAVIEATPPGAACNCNAAEGRVPASEDIKPAVLRELGENDNCGPNSTPCDQFCLCEIQQYSGPDLHTCQTAPTPPGSLMPGYCYVDPSTAAAGDKAAQETIVAPCPATQRRLLRFAGANTPAKGAIAMIACLGATVQQVQ